MNTSLPFVIWATAVLCTGCSSHEPIAAAQVLNHNNCAMTEAGVRVVTYADVARLRGSRLLNMTTAGAGEGDEQESNLLLLAVSKGRQPTPGYGFELSRAFLTADGVATVELRWLTPADDTVQAQVLTQPCIVVGLQRGPFQRVRAVDDTGDLLGEVALQADASG
jgi:hypothetical protein